MPNTVSDYKKAVVVKRTILGYELNSTQNVWANFLLPSVTGCVLYILQTGADIGVAYGHFREGNPIWGALTLFFMICPVIGCFIWVSTTLEMWPEVEGCGFNNLRWILLKIFQHLFFPVWSMWRYAEKIMWSLEALMNQDEDEREAALENVTAPRTIEFYFFLQAFLQSLPQILLQVHILMKSALDFEIETIRAQTMSIVVNLLKVSIVTTLYQRFKTQKIGGKDYPWYKPEKMEYGRSEDVVDAVATRSTFKAPRRRRTGIIYATRENAARLKREYELLNNSPVPTLTSSRRMLRRTSSDLYLLPSGIVETDEVDGVPLNRETSIVDGPPRKVFKGVGTDEVDAPRMIREIKSLPEDDIVGKVIACLWWFCFLIARILAIASFAYFYPRDVIWLLTIHFIICVAFLIYDAQTYVVKHQKVVFFIFIGFVYIFCIIEFMKKFKKANMIYYGFFVLVSIENIVTCFVWWVSNLESEELRTDWWFRFIFMSVLCCTLFSFASMVFYLIINQPKKVVVDEEVVKINSI